ncbi:MAG: EAL domain-containing protein, partial [Actinobacteria bacterium]|nr:EAL domain-containing protein [Actinomycetota bacterium]
ANERAVELEFRRAKVSQVGEWVQSAEQLQRLRLLGCDHAQGNHVCAPTDEAGLRDFVQRAAYSLGSGAGPTPA